jgi:hypothetical protein
MCYQILDCLPKTNQTILSQRKMSLTKTSQSDHRQSWKNCHRLLFHHHHRPCASQA